MKTEDIYPDIAQHVETRFNTSNNDIQRESKKSKKKKVIGLMKDVLGGGIMKEFITVRPKMFTSLTDDSHVDVGKVSKRYKEICNQKRNQIPTLQRLLGK